MRTTRNLLIVLQQQQQQQQQIVYRRITLLPALDTSWKTTQLTSSAAPDITTVTGRTFITSNPSKRRYLNDRVRTSAVPSQAHLTTQVVTHYDPCMAKALPHPHSRMTAS
jgi:hypothetical protein